jgi:hypothetical protein
MREYIINNKGALMQGERHIFTSAANTIIPGIIEFPMLDTGKERRIEIRIVYWDDGNGSGTPVKVAHHFDWTGAENE